MTIRTIRLQLADMGSGECRWVADHSTHVYCRQPMVRCETPLGTPGWGRGPATYMVCTPDSESAWVSIDDAARMIKR